MYMGMHAIVCVLVGEQLVGVAIPHHVGSRDRTQVGRLDCKHLHSLTHLLAMLSAKWQKLCMGRFSSEL